MALPAPGYSAPPSPGFWRRTGGLRWHARVLRYWRLHQPFRSEIGVFLGNWRPASDHLLLVGPSAGWFLPSSFLQRFSRLTAVELDRSAPFFFALRHGPALRRVGTSIEWIFDDFVERLPRVLQRETDAAVLFCNVLGQLGLERADYERQLAALRGRIGAHPWASFHDRYSSRLNPASLPAVEAFETSTALDGARLQKMRFSGEWIDHGTGDVLPPSSTRRYIPWMITPERLHWVEAGTVR